MFVPAFTAKSAWLLRNLKEIKFNRFTRMHLGTRGFAAAGSREPQQSLSHSFGPSLVWLEATGVGFIKAA